MYKNNIPNPIVPKKIINIDNQTMHPAKHLKQNIRIKEITIDNANASNNHRQFYIEYDMYILQICNKIWNSRLSNTIRKFICIIFKGIFEYPYLWNANSVNNFNRTISNKIRSIKSWIKCSILVDLFCICTTIIISVSISEAI